MLPWITNTTANVGHVGLCIRLSRMFLTQKFSLYKYIHHSLSNQSKGCCEDTWTLQADITKWRKWRIGSVQPNSTNSRCGNVVQQLFQDTKSKGIWGPHICGFNIISIPALEATIKMVVCTVGFPFSSSEGLVKEVLFSEQFNDQVQVKKHNPLRMVEMLKFG